MSINEMFEMIEELKTIAPHLSGDNKSIVEMRIASLQKQTDEYDSWVEQEAQKQGGTYVHY